MNILKKINQHVDKKASIMLTEKITYKGKDYLPDKIYFVDQQTYIDFEFINSLSKRTIFFLIDLNPKK